MAKKKNWIGLKYGRLTVIEDLGVNPAGHRLLKCVCECGSIRVVHAGNLTRGTTTSCGCYAIERRREYHTKHGGCHTRLYYIWANMIQRCTNPKDAYYHIYGGKGIKVCDEWLHSFEAFRDWALANGYRDDLSINRIDNEKGYFPENCHWATMKEQQNNRSNNHILTINGKTQTLAQHIEDPEINIYKLGKPTVEYRLYKAKWPEEKIFSTPARPKRKSQGGY